MPNTLENLPNSFEADIALIAAKELARRLGFKLASTEHILMTIVGMGNLGYQNDAIRTIRNIDPHDSYKTKKIQASLDLISVRGSNQLDNNVEINFTERAYCALGLALRDARRRQSSSLGTNNLLIGLIKAHDGMASAILSSLGIGVANIQQHRVDTETPLKTTTED